MANPDANPAPPPYMSWAKDPFDVYSQMKVAIKCDRKDQFVTLIHSPRLRDSKPSPAPSDIGNWIIRRFALNCADAVLSGETSPILDKYFGFPRDGWTALHQAAAVPHYDMVKKLLDSGIFDPNVRSGMTDPIPGLPLNIALKSLRVRYKYHPEWSSAVGLLSSIYAHMDDRLESIRLLALNTSEFHQEFFNYAKQGKMIEVGALLLAAGDQLLPLRISEPAAPFNTLGKISDFLKLENPWWSTIIDNDDEFAECKETLKLLHIYDTIPNQLIACSAIRTNRRSGTEVANLLQAHGFDVQTPDDNLRADSSDSSSINLRLPQINLPWEIGKLFPSQNLYPVNPMNQESEEPSMSIQHVYCEPGQQSFARSICTSAPRTVPMKKFNAVQNLIFNKRLSPLMRIVRRGLVP